MLPFAIFCGTLGTMIPHCYYSEKQKIFINEFVLTQSGFLVECEDISMQY